MNFVYKICFMVGRSYEFFFSKDLIKLANYFEY